MTNRPSSTYKQGSRKRERPQFILNNMLQDIATRGIGQANNSQMLKAPSDTKEYQYFFNNYTSATNERS
jgi:hypothetical protein